MKNPTGVNRSSKPTTLSSHVPAPARTGFSCAGTIFLGKRNRKRPPPGLRSPGNLDGRGFRDAQANGVAGQKYGRWENGGLPRKRTPRAKRMVPVPKVSRERASRNWNGHKRGRCTTTVKLNGGTTSGKAFRRRRRTRIQKIGRQPGSLLRYDSSGWWKPPLKSAELDWRIEYAGDCGASISGGGRQKSGRTGEYPVPSFTYGGGAISAPGPMGGYSLVLLYGWGCGCGQYSLTRGNLVPLEERTIGGRAVRFRARRMRRRAIPQQMMKRNTAAGNSITE
ncbi:hypothetical protein B0H11DRAFT_2104350 [Mycena galericulata]|nr:hypothetical protein B0H11DRAFT_2104350 [Mycena galericulata]